MMLILWTKEDNLDLSMEQKDQKQLRHNLSLRLEA